MPGLFLCSSGIGDAGAVGGREHINGGMSMALHPCPRCQRLIPVGVSYCKDCKPIAEAQAVESIERRQAYKRAKYNKAYNKRRDPKYLKFYRSKEWRTLSRAKLQDSGYRCEARLDGCTHLAVEVHHKEPIQTSEGWEKRLDWDGLEAVCTSCHNGRHPEKFKKKSEPGVIDLKKLTKDPGVG